MAKKHGHNTKEGRTRTYNSWRAARQRCNNENHEMYQFYGERGIKFDKRWDDFKVFLSDMGERPAGKTLDRINVNGNYCKENCRWATKLQQIRNRRVS